MQGFEESYDLLGCSEIGLGDDFQGCPLCSNRCPFDRESHHVPICQHPLRGVHGEFGLGISIHLAWVRQTRLL